MNNKYSLAQLASIYAVYKDLSPTTHTVNCCTCGKSLHINSYEDCYALWGHYIARSISRKLKYHPQNSHAQCPSCNLNETQAIRDSYDSYMKFRYGKNIKDDLLNSEEQTQEYYKEFYLTELLKLVSKFPELAEVVIIENTGEVLDINTIKENNIEEQFNTFSTTYKQDLDIICKTLNTEHIEYERF